jgi:putative FmdB family regulatory protein
MPIRDYQCNKCGFADEYIEGKQTSEEMQHPKICPKCGEGNMENVFDLNGHGGFDIVGFCYMNTQGKHAWKKRMSVSDQAKVLEGKKNPY